MVASFRSVLKAGFAGILLAIVSSVSAAGLSISPLKFEYSIDLNKQESGVVKVTNTSDTAMTLYTSKEDFVAGDDVGTPSFVKPKDQTSDEFSLSNWISLDESHVTLAKGETREVKFNVKVPANAEPGGHYGAIFFAPTPEAGAKVAVVQRIGALVLVNVPGATNVSGDLTAFKVGTIQDKTFSDAESFEKFPISFEAKFKNEGNVHLKPSGKIEITDENGEVIKSVGKESLYTPAGAFIGEKLVDYIPVNDTLGNVLPKSERKFDSIWEGIGYQVLNEDGTKSVKFKGLSEYYADKTAETQKYLKFYESVHTRSVTKELKASLVLAYEGKDKVRKEFRDSKPVKVSYEEQYVGVNYLVVVFVLLIIGGIGFYFMVLLPKSRERMRREIEKEFAKKH